MRSGLLRLPSALAVGLVALALVATAADARGYVGLGFNFGLPIYLPPPVVYAPPPAYYVPPPPPVVYAPPPPPAYYAPQAAAPGQQCREYQSTAMINGQPQQTVGTACLQPDGTWRIVR